MKGKTKTQKGITLIALIITIVVLLILAAVAIASITNDGVLSYAENAATQYNQAVKNEQDTLQGYIDYLNKHNGSSNDGTGSGDEQGTESGSTGITQTVDEVKNEIQTSNIKVVDEFGNQIVVPAGFKIRVDADAGIKGDEKSTATNVTQGIVIEDEDGNQFVWVPVGKIYTDAAKTELLAKTITLGRYAYDPDTGVNDYILKNGKYIPATTISDTSYSWYDDGSTVATIENFYEESATSTGLGQYGNAIARDIEDFKTSANQNGGYYIGRFEAGNASNKLVCKSGETVWRQITQPDSSTLCKNMYNDGYRTGTFSSDLINSYAWDTAIIFIQTFGGDEVIDYYKQQCNSGGARGQDEYCNINDMSGVYWEWTTETCDSINGPCVCRYSYWSGDEEMACGYTSYRSGGYNTTEYSYSYNSFRPLLYVAL